MILKSTFKWNNSKNSDAERKRIFDERQQRRAERLERNAKAGEDGAAGEARDDELAAVDELKENEIELEE